MMAAQQNFTMFDYFVFCGTVGLSLSIGIYFGWKNRHKDSVENYFLGNRKLSVVPTALSLAVTFQSSLMIIGIPAEVYSHGLKYAYYLVGSCTSYIFAGLFVVPVIHPLKLTSANKYFKLRYNNNIVRYLVMSLGIFYYVLYSGSVIFGTCVALDFLMGIPFWGTICMYSIVTAIYTSIGGMKGVVWTDVLQITIMAIGVFGVLIKSSVEVGGMSSIFDLASSRINMDDFRLDPTIRYQFWNLSFGAFMGFLVTCFQQPGIQRINSTRTSTHARRLYILSGIVYAILALCVYFEGVAIFAFYSNNICDPLASGRIKSTNQLVPLAVSDLFSTIPGLSGLFIAALSSAALSTLSSSLSSLGAVTYDDIIREKYPELSESKATVISKFVVFSYGLLAMGFTFFISVLPGSIVNVTYALMGCVDGPTCALFIISMFYSKATTKGLVTGAFAGMAFILWMNIGNLTTSIKVTPTLPPAPTYCCTNETNHTICTLSNTSRYNLSLEINNSEEQHETFSFLQEFYSISFMLYPWIGCIVTILIAVPVSWFTSPPTYFDRRCLFSFKEHIVKELFRDNKNRLEMKVDNIETVFEHQNM